MMRSGRMLLLALLLGLWGAAGAAAEPGPPLFAVTLAPAAPDADGAVRAIDVTLEIDGIAAAAGAPMLRLPIVANTVETAADRIEGLRFRDAQGAFEAPTRDVAQDDANRDRLWLAPRAISGPLRVAYRVPIDPARPPLAAPQYELRTEDGTVSGAATAFLLLPRDTVARRVRVRWDLAAMGSGAVGISSFGVGDVETRESYPPERLNGAYYMAGRPGLFRSPDGGFFGAWQGKLPFSGHSLMQWAARLQAYYGDFFEERPERFGVFGRTNRLNPGSGIGLTDSFAFTFNAESTEADLRGLLAHEMLHAWVRSLGETMDAPGGLAASWFGEGLAVHYQRLLPYRAGLISADAFLDDLNTTAGRYYTNALIGTPNAEIPGGFWRDTRIRVLPYDRGSLYFAKVDAQIRAASGGARSLDDIVRAMLAARRAGEPMDQALWERLLHAELGDEGLAGFRAMLAGEVVMLPRGAFGPCFRRIERPLRRFELGFDSETLLANPRRVRGLIAGSSAAQAGLREGDEILNRFPQDAMQGDQAAVLTLEIRRDGETRTIAYLPRGETVLVPQWERTGAPGCEGGTPAG